MRLLELWTLLEGKEEYVINNFGDRLVQAYDADPTTAKEELDAPRIVEILAGFDLTKQFDVAVAEVRETGPQASQQVSEETQETVEHSTITRRQFTLTLPPPEIIAIQPQYKYYDIQGSPPPDAHTYVLNLAKVSLYNAAKREGILQKAKASCRKQMEQLLSGFDVVINFWDDIEPVKG